MATTYLDCAGLQEYHGLITNYVDTADAKSFKSAKFDDTTRVLSLYKAETTEGTADFTVTIPNTDISGLLAKLTGVTENNVVTVATDGDIKDSGTALSDLATKTYVDEAIVNASHLTKEIVTSLPEAVDAKENVIYMIKDDSVTGDDKYAEYMLIGSEIIKIGDTSIDLSGYIKSDDLTAISSDKIQALFTA